GTARCGPGGHVIASAMSHSGGPVGSEKLTKSLRCLPQVTYRCRRFATRRAKERAERMIGIAKDRAERLLERIEGAASALSSRVELREPRVRSCDLQVAVVPFAPEFHEAFVSPQIVREAVCNVPFRRRSLGEATGYASQTECLFLLAQHALDRRIVLPPAPHLPRLGMHSIHQK